MPDEKLSGGSSLNLFTGHLTFARHMRDSECQWGNSVRVHSLREPSRQLSNISILNMAAVEWFRLFNKKNVVSILRRQSNQVHESMRVCQPSCRLFVSVYCTVLLNTARITLLLKHSWLGQSLLVENNFSKGGKCLRAYNKLPMNLQTDSYWCIWCTYNRACKGCVRDTSLPPPRWVDWFGHPFIRIQWVVWIK